MHLQNSFKQGWHATNTASIMCGGGGVGGGSSGGGVNGNGCVGAGGCGDGGGGNGGGGVSDVVDV